MFSTKLITILAASVAAFSTLAAAIPAAAPAPEQLGGFEIVKRAEGGLEKRSSPGGVYICTDVDWQGQCGYAVQPLNECIHLDYPWWHSISSFGPDQGTACTWYTDYDCQDWIRTDVGHPGYGDLRTVDANDALGSFMCHTG